MKLSTIAKTSLALGILTTGVMTTYAQSADAAQTSIQSKNDSEDVNDLISYYKRDYWNLNNVNGERYGEKVKVFSERAPLTEVKVSGSDKSRYLDENLENIDVFIVRENNTSREATNQSIGGITKPNKLKYKDYVKRVPFSIERITNDTKSVQNLIDFEIKKEELSLKELDFKIRKQLIEKHGLYSNGNNTGNIIIKMKGDSDKNRYTFELHKKLQEHRMGDVIDATQIDRIDVEYK
ncbi:hypothetical protein NQ016_08605 [Staphylococcus hyicus]|uniref:exotoxin beta-grasp domain-containing protein n=1 Tax=Staphylococcus hyicus TaxID=1284 RepID=UPI00211D0896|nr:exotoxin beta-grasp domain-containing protein [Staphylococcus hyicus]MCQ9291553.1 hypothetical protein [Staphylococcus hyicus]MCQ9306794.1 hypothetical protein [Staphylococcus hyicus]MCQ9309567.1 hypothetical protein [Staphylococcus hyicus]MCQ9311628.1 hypothetical protein [Staphylococcus hyicus]